MTGTGKSHGVRVFYCILALVYSSRPLIDASTALDDTPIDKTVSRIDSVLTDIISRMAALEHSPTIAYNCTVEFAAYGLDDPIRYGYIRTSGGSSEEILTPNDPARNRGVTLVELDLIACRTRNRQRFDTYGVVDDIIQVVETIESAVMDTIIVGVTADAVDGGVNFVNSAGPLFTRYNMNIAGLRFRDKFAFIMQKGYPKKTIFQRKPRYQESIRMKVQLRGSLVSEANFVRLL